MDNFEFDSDRHDSILEPNHPLSNDKLYMPPQLVNTYELTTNSIRNTLINYGLLIDIIDTVPKALPFVYFVIPYIYGLMNDSGIQSDRKISILTEQLTVNLQLRFKLIFESYEPNRLRKELISELIPRIAKAVSIQLLSESAELSITSFYQSITNQNLVSHPNFNSFDKANEQISLINLFSVNASATHSHCTSINRCIKKYIVKYSLDITTQNVTNIFKELGNTRYCISPPRNWMSQFIYQIPEDSTSNDVLNNCTVFDFEHTLACKSTVPTTTLMIDSKERTRIDQQLKFLFRSKPLVEHSDSSDDENPPPFINCETYHKMLVYISRREKNYFTASQSWDVDANVSISRRRTLADGCVITATAGDNAIERHFSRIPKDQRTAVSTDYWKQMVYTNNDSVLVYRRATAPETINKLLRSIDEVEDIIDIAT